MRGLVQFFVSVFAFIFNIMVGTALVTAQEPAEKLTDKERLEQCDRDLCAMVNAPSADGPDLACDLDQTWYKEEITEAVKKGRISWIFGDARCSMTLSVSRALLTPALTKDSYELKVPPQPVSCEIDTKDGRHEVKANMAPEIEFEHGKATEVSLGIQDITGTAVVRNVVWAAWKFENTFGFFQDDFIRGVNKYIGEYCPAPTPK